MNAPSWLHCKPRSPFLPVQAEPVEAPSLPALVFKAPYFLDFLDLRQGHDEADLEATILRQIEAFILELGLALRWWSGKSAWSWPYPVRRIQPPKGETVVNAKNGITEVKFSPLVSMGGIPYVVTVNFFGCR